MKKFFFIYFFLSTISIFGQRIYIGNIDTTNFPFIKAKVFVVDKENNIVDNLKKEDFEIRESGVIREIINLTCPQEKETQPISAVLCIDVSGSMALQDKIEIVKDAAQLWVDMLDPYKSECAITSFDNDFYLNQDFTSNKEKLKFAIQSLQPIGGTNYEAAFLGLGSGLGSIGIASKGKYRRIIIFLTDGQPNFEPNVQKIISLAKQNNIVIFTIVVDTPTSQSLYEISRQTGGKVFENITIGKEIYESFLQLQTITHRNVLCDIVWKTDQLCKSNSQQLEVSYLPFNITQKTTYELPWEGTAYLMTNPSFIRFKPKLIGIPLDTHLTVTAINREFEITDVTSTNPDFQVFPKQFFLEKGQSINVNIRYTPKDSFYTYTILTFHNDFCPLSYYLIYGSKSPPTLKRLEVVHPNGGEVFGIGCDTVIKWKNIAPVDTVVIEYSSNKGQDWKLLTDTAYGLEWKWQNIPPPPSDNCLIRITLKEDRDTLIEPFSIDWNLQYDGEAFDWHPNYEYLAFSNFKNIKVIDRDLKKVRVLIGHEEKINCIKFSRDGKFLATSGDDSKIIIWNTQKFSKSLEIISYPDKLANNGVTALDISPDSKYIVTGSNIGNAIVWDLSSGKLVTNLPTPKSSIHNVEFSPDGKYLAISFRNGQVLVYDPKSWSILVNLSLWKDVGILYNPIKFSNKSDFLLLTTNENLYVISTKNWKVQNAIPLNGNVASALAINSQDNIVGLGTLNSSVVFIDLEKSSYIYSITCGLIVNNIKFTEDDTLLTISSNKSISFYSTKDIQSVPPKRILDLEKMNGPIKELIFLPNGNLVSYETIKYYTSYQTKVWENKTWKNLEAYPNLTKISNTGNTYYSYSYGKFVYFNYLKNSLDTLPVYSTPVYFSNISPDENYAIIISSQYYNMVYSVILHIYNLDNSKLDTIHFQSNSNNFFVVFLDNSSIAYVSSGSSVWELDLNTKSFNKIIELTNYSVSYATLSKDNENLAIAFEKRNGYESILLVYSLKEKQVTFNKKFSNSIISYMEFSPDNSFLAIIFSNSKNLQILETSGFQVAVDIVEKQGFNISSARFSPNGKYFFEGTYSGYLLVRNTSNWELEKILPAHARKITAIDVSPDNNYLATGSEDNDVIIWNLTGNLESIQTDLSDSTFSIVPPILSSQDVDMGYVLLGASKDSLVQNFILNNGKFAVKIDTIFIRGIDSKKFKIISNTKNIKIQPGQGYNVEFSFEPSNVGYFEAEIVIDFGDDTLNQTIKGFGVAPVLGFQTKNLDFGKVTIGEKFAIYDTLLVTNISDEPVTIEAITFGGPDFEQFKLIDGGGSFTLLPSEGRKFSVEFAPIYLGRTNGSLLFHYQGFGSPGKIFLYGEGVGGRFKIPDDSGYAGDKKEIQLVMEKISPKGLIHEAKQYTAKVKYQKTILSPPNGTSYEVVGDTLFVSVEGTIDSLDQIVFSLPVVFALGNVKETTVELSEFTLFDQMGYPLTYDFETIPGTFKLLGICEEGGTRLVNPNSNKEIEKFVFNPDTREFELLVNFYEIGKNKLEIYNILGQVKLVIFDEYISLPLKKQFFFDAKLLPKGIFFLVFKSPTETKTIPFVVN